MLKRLTFGLMVVILTQTSLNLFGQTIIVIQPNVTYVTADTFKPAPGPGDTVKILASRTERLKFVGLEGSMDNPIVFINSGGQVNIQTDWWGALEFLHCKHIKVTGTGDKENHFGFKLFGDECGLAFSGLSSDCEAEYIEILGDEDTFFGIYAKKDYNGNPPIPYPQFNNLTIHDTYIHDLGEGMYIGETKSPGMEFRHVRVYNNIVTNTERESIQLANCVEDIEVYNNVMINAGTELAGYQQNLFVLGGNSVGKVYNNILRNTTEYGISVFGMGEIEITNNYLEDNKGIFMDNRYWPLENSYLKVNDNFFKVMNSWEIVKNMNELHSLYVTGNQYDSDKVFFKNAGGDTPLMVVENNNKTTLPTLDFTIEDGKYIPAEETPEEYFSLGPQYPQEPVVERIILNTSMVIDLVPRGSQKSPKNLVNEQNFDPMLDEHPFGQQWRPARNNGNAPFFAEIDLGEEYYLDAIFLHDYKQNGELIISYRKDGNWINITSDKLLSKYKWSEHKLAVKTQKLRFQMNSYRAWINEIALYGYSLNPGMKASNVSDFQQIISESKTIKSDEVIIFPNPASDILNIKYSAADINTQIIDAQGRLLLYSSDKQIDISELPAGLYFVRISKDESKSVITKRLIINR